MNIKKLKHALWEVGPLLWMCVILAGITYIVVTTAP